MTLATLTVSIEKLSSQNKADESPAGDTKDSDEGTTDKTEGDKSDTAELSIKVDAISGKLDDLVTTLSKITDENPRSPAGSEGNEGYL